MTGELVLGTLGVAADQEQIYRVLLRHPGTSATELRAHTGFSHRRLRTALAALEGRAIVARRSGVPARFQPAPPDIVVDALASAREEELSRARLAARALTALPRTPPEQVQVTDLVEVLATPAAVAERLRQLQRAARERVEVTVRPPFAQPPPSDGEGEGVQRALLRRGVQIRAIYDAHAVATAGGLPHIRRMSTLGERARVVGQLPLKLAIFDRRQAVVPLAQSGPAGTAEAGLVVRESALLDGLVALFETYWHRGTEIRLSGATAGEVGGSGAHEETVLTLLASGAKDEAIARQLGVSTHTVRRRIAGLLRRLGATTRFQAGLALGRTGWPGS